MTILNNPKIITGIKPQKRPDPDLVKSFDKTKPLGLHNFPTYSYATYEFTGYQTDPAGIRRPLKWTQELPMAKRISLPKYPGVTITSVRVLRIGGPRQV